MDAYNTLQQFIPVFDDKPACCSDIEKYLEVKYIPLEDNAHSNYKNALLDSTLKELAQKRQNAMAYYNQILQNLVNQFLENKKLDGSEIVVSLVIYGSVDRTQEQEALVELAWEGFCRMLREKNYPSIKVREELKKYSDFMDGQILRCTRFVTIQV